MKTQPSRIRTNKAFSSNPATASPPFAYYEINLCLSKHLKNHVKIIDFLPALPESPKIIHYFINIIVNDSLKVHIIP
jgi:hypothetical protein